MKTLATTCLIACLALPVAAQEELPKEFQEYIEKYATPGPEHKSLKKWIGKWKTENSHWPAPGAPATTFEGEATVRPMIGGRYVAESYKATMKPIGDFEGFGTTAYDRVKKEFVGTWCDNMGTGVMISKGQLSDDGKSIVMRSEEVEDPITETVMTFRIVSTIGDGKTRSMTMYGKPKGGEEFKMMEAIYTKVPRGKGGGKKPRGGDQEGADK